uniref:PABC domain-containing protein n=1 Tax=Knipowitschia caucasica TaxID=637954 RepID=A0AAV2IVC1_KNICA
MEVDVERVGEELYSRIYNQHKDNAGKLTGMLLELPSAVLVQLLQDEAMLTAAVDKAYKALQESTDEPRLTTAEDVSTSSDSLGEQLFELVDLYNTGYSQKITGMLLEQKKYVVLNLLSDPKLLEKQVNQALETLKRESEADLNDSLDVDDPHDFGERLFSLVQQINQDHANELTGMLLEMDRAALHQLLCDHTLLEAAVKKALSALGTNSIEKVT